MANKTIITKDYQKTGSYAQTGRNLGVSRQRVYFVLNSVAKRKYLSYWRDRTRKLRQEGIVKLGSKCCRCGFSDVRALQFDHINGGGNKEIKKKNTMARYLEVVRDSSRKYQLLCANCNWIKREENGENKVDLV